MMYGQEGIMGNEISCHRVPRVSEITISRPETPPTPETATVSGANPPANVKTMWPDRGPKVSAVNVTGHLKLSDAGITTLCMVDTVKFVSSEETDCRITSPTSRRFCTPMFLVSEQPTWIVSNS